ncbi:unnamed protein product, partial [Strongylus vulgaris]
MLRRPLTSIEIKADDIDHMEKVLLDLYQKRIMEKYGYQRGYNNAQNKRKVFKDDDSEDIVETTKEELQNVCSDFGAFTDIILPPSKKMPKRIAGFAFVQFKTRESAEKAKDYFNSNKFQGRMVAADWALPKDTSKKFEKPSVSTLNSDDEGGEDDEEMRTKKFEKPSVSTLNSDDEGGEDDEEM